MLNKDDMVNMQKIGFFFGVGNHAAYLTGELVPSHDRAPEFSVGFVTSFASWSKSVLQCERSKIEVRAKPIGIHFGVKSPVFRLVFALARNIRVVFPSQALVPYWNIAKLAFSAIGVMPPFVLGDSQALASTLVVNGKRQELFATPTLADDRDSFALFFGHSHVF
jgi:hypothetical protein